MEVQVKCSYNKSLGSRKVQGMQLVELTSEVVLLLGVLLLPLSVLNSHLLILWPRPCPPKRPLSRIWSGNKNKEGVTKRCRLSLLTNCAHVYESKCGGRGGVAGSQPMNTAVHITWHGAQVNFGDLPPYLTYAYKYRSWNLCKMPCCCYSLSTQHCIFVRELCPGTELLNSIFLVEISGHKLESSQTRVFV